MNKLQRFYGKAKAPQILAGLLLTMIFLSGCGSTTPNQNPYMLTGAGLGAAMGAGIGAAASPNNPWKGAAIGGLLGTAVGGVGGEMYGRSVNPPPYYQPPQPSYAPPPASYSPPPQPGYSYAPGPYSPSYSANAPTPGAPLPSNNWNTPAPVTQSGPGYVDNAMP